MTKSVCNECSTGCGERECFVESDFHTPYLCPHCSGFEARWYVVREKIKKPTTKKFKVNVYSFDDFFVCEVGIMGKSIVGGCCGRERDAKRSFVKFCDRLGIPRENYEFSKSESKYTCIVKKLK